MFNLVDHPLATSACPFSSFFRRSVCDPQNCFDWKIGNVRLLRGCGGIKMYTTMNLTSGVEVAAGGGSWSSLSDRARKENFAAVDPVMVLQKVAGLPIQTWNYKTQDPSIRHIGPTAQDFRAAFGLGENDTTINTVDADGTALAAIQGLHVLLQQQGETIKQLQQEIERLKGSPR